MSIDISLDPNTIVFLVSVALWIVIVITIFVAGRWWTPAKNFSQKIKQQWKPALGIAALYFAAAVFGTQDIFGPVVTTPAIFCKALIGLTLAYSIADFEPLPVIRSILKRERIWRRVGSLVGLSLLLVPVSLLVGAIGMNIGGFLFGEVQPTNQAVGTLPGNPWQVFFMLLSGAGIAEEIVYRLVLLTLFWQLTRRPWIGIMISSILFGAYHLTPLTSMYQEFWQYPISQFLASMFIGILWGYVYTKRGFETVVLTHTLTNWLPFFLYVTFNAVA
jgi:membrane protease YdiL (CAAX protease family)